MGAHLYACHIQCRLRLPRFGMETMIGIADFELRIADLKIQKPTTLTMRR